MMVGPRRSLRPLLPEGYFLRGRPGQDPAGRSGTSFLSRAGRTVARLAPSRSAMPWSDRWSCSYQIRHGPMRVAVCWVRRNPGAAAETPAGGSGAPRPESRAGSGSRDAVSVVAGLSGLGHLAVHPDQRRACRVVPEPGSRHGHRHGYRHGQCGLPFRGPSGMRQTLVMSTTRRRLGTGPTAISSTPSAEESPRLLPAERVDLGGLLKAPEQSDPELTRSRRRPLRSPAVGD